MKIPLPCEFGKTADCNGRLLPLEGVTWFRWSRGMEYTYFFTVGNRWNSTDFYATFDPNKTCEFIISDSILENKIIKEHGYPLKGTGYASGIFYKNGKTYMEFIMSSNYFAHIKVQCDKNGLYIPGGDVIWPPSWDTDEKREKVILKSYKFIKDAPTVDKKEKKEHQYNLVYSNL